MDDSFGGDNPNEADAIRSYQKSAEAKAYKQAIANLREYEAKANAGRIAIATAQAAVDASGTDASENVRMLDELDSVKAGFAKIERDYVHFENSVAKTKAAAEAKLKSIETAMNNALEAEGMEDRESVTAELYAIEDTLTRLLLACRKCRGGYHIGKTVDALLD